MPTLPDPTAVLALPIGVARAVLVPPVRALRHVAVAAARTVRHWEVVLEVAAAPAQDDEPSFDGSADAAEAGRSPRGAGWDAEAMPAVASADGGSATPEVDLRDARDLPVEDWPQLSLADAHARTSQCTPSDLAALLAYEQQHGRRVAFELMLQQRLRTHVG